MTTSIEVLEAEVLSLSAEDRSRLLDRLIASLGSDPEIEKAWAAEADRRDAEIDNGMVTAVPAEQALARLRAGLR